MFVAINHIPSTEKYNARLEGIFTAGSKTFDKIKGFRTIQVLRPVDEPSDYLIISQWDSQDDYQNWSSTAEFLDATDSDLNGSLSNPSLEGSLGNSIHQERNTFRAYHEVKATRKVNHWIKRIGIIGILFFLIKGLIWLALIFGIGNVLTN